MKLSPYPDVKLRYKKLCKHVFDHRERWWEVFGDLQSWHASYTVLRGAGCFLRADGWQAIDGHSEAEPVANGAHESWLGAAGAACDEAVSAGRLYPCEDRKVCYVGEHGVTVYVAPGAHLVTCFRPRRCVGSRRAPEDVTRQADTRARHKSGYFARAGVRRSSRRASLQSKAKKQADRVEPS